MNLSKAFGQTLRELRHLKGLSQEDLAIEAGYHRTYISLLERGLKTPTLQTVFDLAESLEVLPSEVVKRVEVLGRNRTSTLKRSTQS
jgi:transcriptional regulator with XRE-family HTH domain